MEYRIFEIQYSTPDKDGERWRKNRIAFVATSTAQEALGLLLEQEPEADIWQCIHRTRSGARLIIDPRLK